MANYPPDPTATQAPAAAPDPDNFPLLDLPADLEDLDAASVNQAFKALGDYIAWLKSPRAKASSWAQAVRAYKNALLHIGAGFDHQGLPSGRFAQWQEDWVNKDAAQITVAGSGGWFGRWNYRLVMAGSGSGLFANGPWLADLSTHPWGSILGLAAGNSSSIPGALHVACAEMIHPAIVVPNAATILEGAFSINGGTLIPAPFSAAWGFGDGGFVASGSTDPINTGAAIPNGSAYFAHEAGGGFWKCISRTAGGSTLSTTTSVAVALDAPHRGRIEIIGATASDDSAARVIFSVDGTVVANHAHSLVGVPATPFFRATSGNAGALVLNVGPMRFTARLDLGSQPLT